MNAPIMPHPFPQRRGGGWTLLSMCAGAAVAFFWRHELGRYGSALICVGGLVGFVLDELTSKRAT